MIIRRLIFRWRWWRIRQRHQEETGWRHTAVLLHEACQLLDPELLKHYRPSLGLKINFPTMLKHFGEMIDRLDTATLVIRENEFVAQRTNRYGETKRKRLDDFLVNGDEYPLGILEATEVLRDYLNRYHEAYINVKGEERATYYRRQYSRLNEEVFKFLHILIKVMENG